MRRVVVTGLGLVTPLGNGVEATWSKLLDGQSGVKKIYKFDVSDLASKIAGQIPLGEDADDFRFDDYASAKDRRRMGNFIIYGLSAASQAIADSGWDNISDAAKERTGVILGSAVGGLTEISTVATASHGDQKALSRLSPFFIPANLINLLAGQVSIKYGYKGPNKAVSMGCVTGSMAIADAMRSIMDGEADVMIAGAAEAPLCRLGIAGFAQAKMLSTQRNNTPHAASRPWDRSRDGMVMGEGAGVLVLEDYAHAKKRGAFIYAELKSYATTGDAHHITSPDANGLGMMRCMRTALRKAHMDSGDVDFVSAHATSTAADMIELGAIKSVFGPSNNRLSISSSKSAFGHMMGAADAVDAVLSALSIRDGVVPPTLNLDDPEDGFDFDLVPHAPRERSVRNVVSNAFGFGGANSSLVFSNLS